LRAALERTVEHIGKLRLANAPVDGQEEGVTIKWSGLLDQDFKKDVYLSSLTVMVRILPSIDPFG
jgi:hypothetical protein